jgi:hypothetical protein
MSCAYFARSFEAIKEVAQWVASTSRSAKEGGGRKPFTFTWRMAGTVALICVIFWVSVAIWGWPIVFLIWMLTPHAYLLGFVIYQFLRWNTDHVEDGLAALVGFVFVTIGTALQLIGAIL